jgi:glutamyl-tRNA reductase
MIEPLACSAPDTTGATDANPGLVALATHARLVASEERERFAREAAALEGDPRVMVVRTCHRVEVYSISVPETEAPPPLLPALPTGGRRLEGGDVVRHLLSVAAGLDSVVVGEDQILHQLRDCLSERHLAGFGEPAAPGSDPLERAPGRLDPVLERLFQVALHLGRETRSWREGPPRSLADVALDRLEAWTGPLLGRSVLVVGAGRMGRLAAIGVGRRGGRALVSNRSADRAAALAFDAGGAPHAYGRDVELPEVDGIVLAIAAHWDLGAVNTAQLVAGSTPVVDLSSPPALPAELRTWLGERYISVDDLARSPEDAFRERFRARLERRLDEAQAEFEAWVRGRVAVPTIQALAEQAEQRRASELDRLFRRIPDLDEHDRELVEQMSRRLVAGILHAPFTSLHDDGTGELDQAARTLFAL